ncbi:MAG: holB [Dehalococcoidia bacterium]|nr:holB [Dehalococcoidia bacterium]
MWQVVGHEAAITLLSRSLERDMLSHAYIFVGPPQVGKMTLALALAQGVNCLASPASRPCGECSQCRRIAQGRHPDVQVVDLEVSASRATLKKEIGIDQVREVQHWAILKPYEGRCRVIVFREAAHLSSDASNALLKLLEEPPESVLFILLTIRVESILPTVLSRCQRVDLNPLSLNTVARELLSTRGIPPQEAMELARLSGGRIGWALEAAGNPQVLIDYTREVGRVASLVEDGLEERFAYAAELATLFPRDREKALGSLKTALSWWRDLLLVKKGGEELVSNVSAREALHRCSQWVSTPQVVEAIKRTQDTMDCLEANVNPSLALEVLMLSLPRRDG